MTKRFHSRCTHGATRLRCSSRITSRWTNGRKCRYLSYIGGEKMVIELGHPKSGDAPATDEKTSDTPVNRTYSKLRGMVFDSVGPIRHEVSVPFHDSQVRGAALLIQTGWDRRWGTEAYWEPG